MSTVGYAAEQLTLAVRYLAVTDGNVRDRFRRVANERILWIPAGDLPEDLRSEVDDLKKSVTCQPPTNGEDKVTPTIAALTDEEIRTLIDKVLDICFRVRAIARASPPA